MKPRIALLGGSFNPPHLGHFRLAVEILERLAPEHVELLPCFLPPHKKGGSLLPFDLRLEMLKQSLQGEARILVNPLEAERDSPSYTCLTLKTFRQRNPLVHLIFVMGSNDFSGLAHWRNWEKLPFLADLLVVDRPTGGNEDFTRDALRLWPEASSVAPPQGLEAAFSLPNPDGPPGQILYLRQPRLDISSSLVRRRWLAGRSIRFLVPEAVEALLVKNSELAKSCWT